MSVVDWIVLALAVLAIVLVAAGWRATAKAKAELEAQLTAERTEHAETRKSNGHLETRMRSLRNELADAHQTNAELTTRIGRTNPSESGRALGFWALERHRQARVAGTPLLGLAVGPGMDLIQGLTDAIRVELELLREEVGTHAELTAVALEPPLDPRDAMAVLRVVQELAATLAKRADELAVTVARDDTATVVTVAAIGCDDPPASAAAFMAGLAALDGTLELRPDPEAAGTLLAIVRLGEPEDQPALRPRTPRG